MSPRATVKRLHVKRQTGLSLIELMIGMTLGLIVLGAVLYLFAGNRANYRHQESLALVQESGRFALELLARDIRMAGYAGCGNAAYVENLTPGEFGNETAIGGTSGANATTPDSITIQRASFRMATLEDMPAGDVVEVDDLRLLSSTPSGLENRRIVITDCAYLETFMVDDDGVNETSNQLTANAPLIRSYQPSSQLMPFEQVTYDVFDNALRQNNQSIAEGVSNMKILYGIDTTGDRSADSYIASPADWTQVVSVRINLTVTERDVTLPYSMTVTLRNRVP